jgi:hypothetical protein
MKITTGKVLYVCADSLALLDGFESNAQFTQSAGERQVVISADCFECSFNEGAFDSPLELQAAALEIMVAIEKEKPDDINLYC